MLFDLPWQVDEPERGFLLRDDADRVGGFLGTIFSRRVLVGRERRFCHLSSWFVEPEHRAESFGLILRVLALKSHTLVNLSASDAAHEIFLKLGFRVLETRQVMIPLLSGAGALARNRSVRSLLGSERAGDGLPETDRRLVSDMAATRAGILQLCDGPRRCLAIATRSPWKPGLSLAQVEYASDWNLFAEWYPMASVGFARLLRTAGLRVDGRHWRARVPALAVERALPRPLLYRPSEPEVSPGIVDGLYSERVNQPR